MLGGSLSARRAWIEILVGDDGNEVNQSLSARRAWIEIFITVIKTPIGCVSLSARRAWIEIMPKSF